MSIEVVNSLDVLFPPFREQAEKFAEKAKDLDFFVYETYRSFDKQMEYYQSGRELQNGVWIVVDPKAVRTHAKPGMSFHAYGLAFDAVVDDDATKQGIQWSWKDTYKDADGTIQKVDWKGMGKLSVSLGMEWAGNWVKFTEYPHSQNRFGFQVSELYTVLTSDGLDAVWKKIYAKIGPSSNVVNVPIAIAIKPIPVPVVAKEDLDHISNTAQTEQQNSSIVSLIMQIFNVIISIFSKERK